MPKRVNRRLTVRSPTVLVASTKKRPSLRKYESDSVSRFITSRSLSASPSTSATCTPIPALGAPSWSMATPRRNADSAKRPPPWFIHR